MERACCCFWQSNKPRVIIKIDYLTLLPHADGLFLPPQHRDSEDWTVDWTTHRTGCGKKKTSPLLRKSFF